VDTEADLHAPLAQLPGQVRDRVLGLGGRHAVARRDDDRVGVGQEGCRSGSVDLAVLAIVRVTR
jgi:hypothetical protein